MSKLETILTYCPWAEVTVRRAYYFLKDKPAFSKAMEQSKRIISKRRVNNQVTGSVQEIKKISGRALFEHIKNYGIAKGDILMVHSSLDGLAALDMSAKEILDELFTMVGEEGTLVFPSMPQFTKTENIDGEDVPIYDIRRTLTWTGLLPNMFLRTKGTVRSALPFETLAANGYRAMEMFRSEHKADTPQGKYTAWEYCSDNHAKVLFLGVKPYHSLTEAHMAEDLMSDSWPIKDWYEYKRYLVKSGDNRKVVTIHERKTEWARFIPEFNNALRMKRNGSVLTENYQGIELGYIADLNKFNADRIKLAKKGEIDYRIPRKYWKR